MTTTFTYYWAPCNNQTLGPVVTVMGNATTNGTPISIYTKGNPIATGQTWEVLGYGQFYYMRPQNCLAPPTSVLDMDNGIGNNTHLWEYYPNANQLFDFWPIDLAGVTYNYIRRVSDGAYISYIGTNNGNELYSTSSIQDNNRSVWRWYLHSGIFARSASPGNPITVSADFIKKNATRIPDPIPRPIPTPAALERLYAAVRKTPRAITEKPAPKLTDTKALPASAPASKLKVEAKKAKKPASRKPSKAVKKPKKAASKKAKKPAAKRALKPKAGKKPKAPKSKKLAAEAAKKAPKKAAAKKAKK